MVLMIDLLSDDSLDDSLVDSPPKGTLKQRWYERRDLLLQFIKENQRYPHHHEIYDGFNIYHWMMCQCSFYERNILKEDKILLWNEIITAVPSTMGPTSAVGLTTQQAVSPTTRQDVSLQKKIYHKSKAHIEFYSNIWMTSKNLLVEFIKIHQRLPMSKEIFKNTNIGHWVTNQRYRRKILQEWQLMELHTIPEWSWSTQFFYTSQKKTALAFILN